MEWQTHILSRTRDRRKNYLFSAAPYVENNSNDDHARPGRFDYSVMMLKPGSQEPGVRSRKIASLGRWTLRTSGSQGTPMVAWTIRAAGAGETGLAIWTTRRTATTATGTVNYLFRAEGTHSTPATAWATCRTGTRTS